MKWLWIAICCGAMTAGAQELTPAQLEKELDAYRLILLDWGGLAVYGSDNTELRTRPQVVFLGDELTEQWPASKFFPGKPYVNRGITRQTAGQMLVRFRQDVLDLKPDVVVIEAGSADIASVMGPSPETVIAGHLSTMAELAKLHGIKVVLASVTPVCDCGAKKQTLKRPGFKISSLNAWMKDYAKDNGAVYLDYYSVLAEGRTMKRELTADGLVPNEAGYERMATAAEKAIAEALAK